MRTPQVPLGFRKPTVKTTFSFLIWANTVSVHYILVPQKTSILTAWIINFEIKEVRKGHYKVVKVGKITFSNHSVPPFQTVLETHSALMRSWIPSHLWILKLVHPQWKMGIICFYSCLWDLPNFFLFWLLLFSFYIRLHPYFLWISDQ